MIGINLGAERLGLWIHKGLCFWRLSALDAMGEASLARSSHALEVGVGLAVLVQFVVQVVSAHVDRTSAMLLQVPFAALMILHLAVLVFLLFGLLRLVGRVIGLQRLAALAFLAYSGFAPVYYLAASETLATATSLYARHRDPGIDYMNTATHQLLHGPNRQLEARSRAWLFSMVQIGAVAAYFLYGLPRAVGSLVRPPLHWLWVSLLVTITLWALYWLSRHLFGRAYWMAVGSLLGPPS